MHRTWCGHSFRNATVCACVQLNVFVVHWKFLITRYSSRFGFIILVAPMFILLFRVLLFSFVVESKISIRPWTDPTMVVGPGSDVENDGACVP